MPHDGKREHNGTSSAFVLCAPRSGSTLLRSIIGAHPDVYCPAETNLVKLVDQSRHLELALNGGPYSYEDLPILRDAMDCSAGIVQAVDAVMSDAAKRAGKKMWCDKSLTNVRSWRTLLNEWPNARFLCLHRHLMDVVHSALLAQPWGFHAYGLTEYIARYPANFVEGLARCWADSTVSMLSIERSAPERVCSLRYEDLVAAPREVAAGVFHFLGLPPPDEGELMRLPVSGAGDHKIPYRDDIDGSTVGRGLMVPVDRIDAELREPLNSLLAALDYQTLDDYWGCPSIWRPNDRNASCSWKEPPTQGGERQASGTHLDGIIGICALNGTDVSQQGWVDLRTEHAYSLATAPVCPGHPVVITDVDTLRSMGCSHFDIGDAVRRRAIRVYSFPSEWDGRRALKLQQLVAIVAPRIEYAMSLWDCTSASAAPSPGASGL